MVYIIKFKEEAPEGRFRTDRQNSFFLINRIKLVTNSCAVRQREPQKEAKLISYACHLNDYLAYLALFPVSR